MRKKPLPGGLSYGNSDSKISYDQPNGRMLNASLRIRIAPRVIVGTNKKMLVMKMALAGYTL
jgi:hypothetical protein